MNAFLFLLRLYHLMGHCLFLWVCDLAQSANDYLLSPVHEYDDVRLKE